MNTYAKFQLRPPIWLLRRFFNVVVFFFVFFFFFFFFFFFVVFFVVVFFSRKFSLSVAMAKNQNQRFGQNSYGW